MIFDEAMTSLTAASNAALLEAYDFGRFRTIVDVGGGNGTLLATILDAHPGTHGILFDQAHVVSGAGRVLRAAKVLDRCEIVAGSFFDAVPEGADAYILKSIIHDWEDEDSVTILRGCRRAMSPESRVLLVERDLGASNENPGAKLSDLNMLVMTGGRERSNEEYAGLLAQAGLRHAGTTLAASGYAVIEAEIQ